MYVKNIVNEVCKKILSEAMRFEFSFSKLIEIGDTGDFGRMIDYCKEMLGPDIGTGSSRMVFQIDDEKCLKLAINRKGIIQNELEFKNYSDEHINHLFPRVISELSDNENFYYIVSEYVLPAEKRDFEPIIGVDYETFSYLILCASGFMPRFELSEDDKELVYNNPYSDFMVDVLSYSTNYNVHPQEITRIQNIGLCQRNGECQLVLLDNGVNEEIMNKYYRK